MFIKQKKQIRKNTYFNHRYHTTFDYKIHYPCFSIILPIYLSIFYWFAYLSIYKSICRPSSITGCPLNCVLICLSEYLYNKLSLHLFIYLLVYPHWCMLIRLSSHYSCWHIGSTNIHMFRTIK